MNLSVATVPNPVLRAPTQTVGVFDEELQTLITAMRQVMHGAKGVGLAAPQVGLARKLAVIEYDPERFRDDDRHHPGPIPFLVITNPRITQLSHEQEVLDEGCLSIPEVGVPVSRAVAVTVLAQNEKGERIRLRAKGFLARILQHEIDHLHGTLIVDRTTDKKIRKQFSQPVSSHDS